MSNRPKNSDGYFTKNTFPISQNFQSIMNAAVERLNPIMAVSTRNAVATEQFKLMGKKVEELERIKCDLKEEIKDLKTYFFECITGVKVIKVKKQERKSIGISPA